MHIHDGFMMCAPLVTHFWHQIGCPSSFNSRCFQITRNYTFIWYQMQILKPEACRSASPRPTPLSGRLHPISWVEELPFPPPPTSTSPVRTPTSNVRRIHVTQHNYTWGQNSSLLITLTPKNFHKSYHLKSLLLGTPFCIKISPLPRIWPRFFNSLSSLNLLLL